MRIGIVSYWFNRGQATVSRYIRSIFDELGHKTFVLARPTKHLFDLSGFIDTTDVWKQPDVTYASRYDIPLKEYSGWAKANALEVVFFDQNYQFREIASLRASGIKTIGRFVWESFEKKHVKKAKAAFDIIYSLTRCEQARYAGLGIESPWIQWGCHEELTTIISEKKKDGIYFFFPGGYLSQRKSTHAVIKAFSQVRSPDIRLIIKTQTHKRKSEHIGDPNKLDPRIMIISADIPSHEYYKLFSSCHICLAPSRWEGLGQHLYEAVSFAMPIITNDNPPMNEVVEDKYNGLLVRSYKIGTAPSGIPAYEPYMDSLMEAIYSLSERSLIDELTVNAAEVRNNLSWDVTIDGFKKLLI
jgi:1,2-diacylglycerol 3-alpha-glucosyltransferase